jgi:hypothetical protein
VVKAPIAAMLDGLARRAIRFPCMSRGAAADRPYKPAMSPERALDILTQERAAGAIDPPLLDLFVELRPWEQDPSSPASMACPTF